MPSYKGYNLRSKLDPFAGQYVSKKHKKPWREASDGEKKGIIDQGIIDQGEMPESDAGLASLLRILTDRTSQQGAEIQKLKDALKESTQKLNQLTNRFDELTNWFDEFTPIATPSTERNLNEDHAWSPIIPITSRLNLF